MEKKIEKKEPIVELWTLRQYMSYLLIGKEIISEQTIHPTDSEEIANSKAGQALYQKLINMHPNKKYEPPSTNKNMPHTGKQFYLKLLLSNIEPKYLHKTFDEIDVFLKEKNISENNYGLK